MMTLEGYASLKSTVYEHLAKNRNFAVRSTRTLLDVRVRHMCGLSLLPGLPQATVSCPDLLAYPSEVQLSAVTSWCQQIPVARRVTDFTTVRIRYPTYNPAKSLKCRSLSKARRGKNGEMPLAVGMAKNSRWPVHQPHEQ